MLNATEYKSIILINVKMPTIVGILTFISMIDTRSENLKARKVLIFQRFSFCEQLKFKNTVYSTNKVKEILFDGL